MTRRSKYCTGWLMLIGVSGRPVLRLYVGLVFVSSHSSSTCATYLLIQRRHSLISIFYSTGCSIQCSFNHPRAPGGQWIQTEFVTVGLAHDFRCHVTCSMPGNIQTQIRPLERNPSLGEPVFQSFPSCSLRFFLFNRLMPLSFFYPVELTHNHVCKECTRIFDESCIGMILPVENIEQYISGRAQCPTATSYCPGQDSEDTGNTYGNGGIGSRWGCTICAPNCYSYWRSK